MATHTPHPGRLVMVDIEGTRLDAATAGFLRQNQVRAVCLFRKNIADEAGLRRLCGELREVMGPGALIAVDQEGGAVVRAPFLPQAPSAMALGAAGDEALAERVGAAVARGLRGCGVNWNFAPVLDVNNNPANPVIAERSFGADPQAVARLAGAWMRGSLVAGVACCVKHFPGHGDTHQDSHHELPTVDKPLAALEALELLPFRALAGQAPALMTAHIVYPQIDAEHPATLSPRWLTGLLRGAMAYDGVVITDALMMRAVHQRYGHARAAVLALRAGADMVLAQGTRSEQQATLDAIAAALDEGRLAADALLRSATRLDALAARFPATVSPYGADQREADEALMGTAWARGLCALGGARPPQRQAPLRVLTQARVDSDGVAEAGASSAQVRVLFEGFPDVEFVELADLRTLDAAALAADGRQNIVVSNHRLRYPAGAAALRPALHLVLWNPFQALDLSAPTLLSWGYADAALASVRVWLEGRAEAPGRAPVPLQIPSPA
jgi:beta-N-acetylhexosaminidase